MLRLLATALIAAAGSAGVAASAPVAPDGPTIEMELERAKAETRAALKQQKKLEKAAADARDDVSRIRAEQLAAAQAIAVTESRISAADSAARLAVARLALQRQRLDREQAPLSALLAGLVLTSRRPPLALLADSDSAAELVKLRILIDSTAPLIRSITAALSAELEDRRRLEREALEARAEILEQREILAGKRAALAALEGKAEELARKRGIEALGAGDVALASSERLSAVEGTAQTARAASQSAARLASLGPAPIRGETGPVRPQIAYRLPSDARVIDGLGAVSANGIRSRGVTFATRRGSPLVAPASGTILFSGPFGDYDGIIIIDHGSGWKSVLVNAGSKLRKGDRIAIGQPLGIALGQVEIQVNRDGRPVSAALIAGSSAMLSNDSKGG